MLKTIEIKNFKSHMNTEINLSSGVTVIYGKPQSGKSNIVRAITLCNDNKPLGTKFLSNFSKKGTVSVKIVTGEDHEVLFQKDIGVTKKGETKILSNQYQVDGGEPFTGFGKSVPDIVSNVLNLSELNIQKQLDEPYLITSSGGEFSRTVNRITNLDEANRWTQELSSTINGLSKSIKTKKEDLKSLEGDIEELDGLDDIEAKVEQAEMLTLDIKIIQNKIDMINSLHERITGLTEEIDIISKILKPLEEKIDFYETKQKELEDTETLLSILNKIVEIDYVLSLKPKIEEAEKMIEDYNRTFCILALIAQIQNIDKDIKENNEVKDKLVAEFIDELEEFMVCPICSSEIDSKTVELVRSELI